MSLAALLDFYPTIDQYSRTTSDASARLPGYEAVVPRHFESHVAIFAPHFDIHVFLYRSVFVVSARDDHSTTVI
jgi:hypothetical protein